MSDRSPQKPQYIDWSDEEYLQFGNRPQVSQHHFSDLPIFTNSGLIELLDRYPRDRLQAFTMGTDPRRTTDWRPVSIGKASGEQMFQAAMNGRLWFNILKTEEVDPRFAELLEAIYAPIAAKRADFRPFRKTATLLLSSPSAMVYFHVDGPPNMLWHIRGKKRVFVYPACDERFIPMNVMEDIFASAADEEMPFDESFDANATAYDLEPGEVVSWPHNAPHRVVNLNTLNVSLSTTHYTEDSERRKLIYLSNRFFKRRLGIPLRSTREVGVGAEMKMFAYRACRRIGLDPSKPRFDYTSKLRVDHRAPLGYSESTNETRPG